MSEAKELRGEIEAVSRGERGIGIKIEGQWYNSTSKTIEAMDAAQKGEVVHLHFLENESNGKTYRNIIGYASADDVAMEAIEEDVDGNPVEKPKPAPKPAAPQRSSATPSVIDRKHIVQIQGKDFVTFNGVLDAAHKKGIKNLTLKEMHVEGDSAAWCVAHVEFKDGSVFEATGSVNKANSAGNMGAKWAAELAQTRAYGRAMRIGLNLDYVMREEMDE